MYFSTKMSLHFASDLYADRVKFFNFETNGLKISENKRAAHT